MGAIHANAFTEKLFLTTLPRLRKESLFLRDAACGFSEDKTERNYELCYRDVIGDRLVAAVTFRARLLPGCCGVLVVYYLRPSHSLNVVEAQCLYQDTVHTILGAAKRAKIGLVQMSLLATSKAAIEILIAEGFTKSEFINGKTGNAVVLFQKNLDQPIPASQKFACE